MRIVATKVAPEACRAVGPAGTAEPPRCGTSQAMFRRPQETPLHLEPAFLIFAAGVAMLAGFLLGRRNRPRGKHVAWKEGAEA